MFDAKTNLKGLQAPCGFVSPKEYELSAIRCTQKLKVYYKMHRQVRKEYEKRFEELKTLYPDYIDKRSGLPKKKYLAFFNDRLPKIYYLPYTSE